MLPFQIRRGAWIMTDKDLYLTNFMNQFKNASSSGSGASAKVWAIIHANEAAIKFSGSKLSLQQIWDWYDISQKGKADNAEFQLGILALRDSKKIGIIDVETNPIVLVFWGA